MKKVIILLCFMVSIILILNVVLIYFMLLIVSNPNDIIPNINNNPKIVYYTYPHNYPNNSITNAIFDEETALAIGKAMLEEYYHLADVKYEAFIGQYYCRILGYTEIERYTDSSGGKRVKVDVFYVDIHTHDCRVLYVGHREEVW